MKHNFKHRSIYLTFFTIYRRHAQHKISKCIEQKYQEIIEQRQKEFERKFAE